MTWKLNQTLHRKSGEDFNNRTTNRSNKAVVLEEKSTGFTLDRAFFVYMAFEQYPGKYRSWDVTLIYCVLAKICLSINNFLYFHKKTLENKQNNVYR